ncbi:hypothetical protein SAMN03159494_04646 [Achromobacter sp. NFACC18-2]|nr:hypothetical protein SAMN03159494_04646 [Achromobacter sp. NFACC18-2]
MTKATYAARLAGPGHASNARQCNGPPSRLRGSVAARPCPHRTRDGSPARSGEQAASDVRHAEHGRCAATIRAAARRGADRPTGQPATPCRSARPRRPPGVGRCRCLRLQLAVELRLRKKALAVRRMSLARRSSRFSRSSTLIRSRSLVVTPSRCPLSTSWRLTQVSSVCAEQPILGAIDSTPPTAMDTRCDDPAPGALRARALPGKTCSRCSCSWLKLSPDLEPPRHPGRFTLR